MKVPFKKFAVGAALLIFSPSSAWAEGNDPAEPILPYDSGETSLPFVANVLLNVPPEQAITSDKDETIVLKEIGQLERAGKDAAKTKKLFNHYSAILQYWSSFNQGVKEEFGEMQANMCALTERYKPTAKDKNERLRMRYHATVCKFLTGEGKSLRGILSRKLPLSEAHYARWRLMRGMLVLEENRIKGLRIIQAALQPLDTNERIPVYLALGRALGGVNKEGRKVDKPLKKYREYIELGTMLARVLEIKEKRTVLNFAVATSLEAEGEGVWTRLPIHKNAFNDLPEIASLEERRAIGHLKRGDTATAIQVYLELSRKNQGTPVMASLDERILDIREIEAKKTQNPLAYEEALHAYTLKYRKNVLGENNIKLSQETAQKFQTRYGALVKDNMAKCLGTQPQAEPCQAAIALAVKYTEIVQDKKESVNVRAMTASVYRHIGDYRNAVHVFAQLAEETKGQESLRYLRAALEGQHILANWPKTAPWDRKPLAAADPQLTALAAFYEKLLKVEPTNWEGAAHLGLIHYVNREAEKGFALWEAWIEKTPGTKEAQLAAGLMLNSYAEETKNWDGVVRVSHRVMKKQVTPEYQGQELNTKEYLGNGLYHGAAATISAKKYTLATQYLEEFTKDFAKDPRHSAALFSRGDAYHFAGNDVKATLALKQYVETYPKGAQFMDALVNGIKWSKADKMSIFFHEQFIVNYNKDARVPPLRDSLIKLYVKNALYGAAARSCIAKSQDERTSKEEKLNAAWQQLRLEDKYGDLKKALWGAGRIIELSEAENPALADALGVLARYAAKYGKYDQVVAYEKKIENFPFKDPVVKKNLAQIRLIIARHKASKPLPDVQVIALKKPLQTVYDQFKIYLALRKNFEKVCAVDNGTLCEDARLGLSKISQKSFETISEITMATALDDKHIAAFNNKKATILDHINGTIIKDQLAGH